MIRRYICKFALEWCGFFFQAEDGIRDLVRSRGLGGVYKRQRHVRLADEAVCIGPAAARESYLVADRLLDAACRTLSLIHI